MNDLISRQSVLDAFDSIPIRGIKRDGEYLHALVSLAQILNVIDQLPPTQLEEEQMPDNDLSEITEEEFVALKNNIGLNLRNAILKSGIAQKDLAKKINVTEVTLSRYVTGNRIPSALILYRIARVLGVPLEELIEGKES